MALKNFPRGTHKVQKENRYNKQSINSKIKCRSKGNKNENTSAKKNEITLIEGSIITLNSADNLKYSSICEGMTILGRVYKITDYSAIMALPGQINGKLNIADISETYTELLKNITLKNEVTDYFKPFTDLYKVGDYVTCYIKDLSHNPRKISLSTEPFLINQNLNLNILKISSKIIGNIKDVEDHGYILETGLTNFQAFLPFDNVVSKKNFYPGKQVICTITDIKTIENTFIANVSTLQSNIDTTVGTIRFSPNNLIPSTKCNLTIKSILHNGLQVYYDKSSIGYINQVYIQKPLSSFKIGQELVGTLLYILPTIKIAYFSLLSEQEQELKKNLVSIGDVILKAKVLSHDARGIIVQLNGDINGFVPFKRTEVDFEKISSVFTINSFHECKIIAYDLMSKLYICSMEKNLIKEELISKTDLKPGDKVKVTVCSTRDGNKCVNVSIGKNIGFVPYEHVSDPGSSAKITVGQCVTAKILESSNKLIFTLKKSLVDSKLPILSKIEEAKIDSNYDGTVIKISSQGVLVHFFGDVKGWLPQRFFNVQSSSLESPRKLNFILGQTISVTVKSIDIEKKKLIIAPLKNKCNKNNVKPLKVNIGDMVEGIVIDSSSVGVNIRLINKEIDEVGFLPAGHMSPCQEIGKLLASKTIAGHKLSAIVFSVKPSLILSTTFVPEKTYKLNDLNIGDLVMCSVKKINNDSLSVTLPIERSSISCKIVAKNVDNLKYTYKHQILFGKILQIDKKSKEINLTTQLRKVWSNLNGHDFQIMTAIDLLSAYFSKVLELSSDVYYTSRPISELRIGARIKGKVEAIINHGLVLNLNKGMKGIVKKCNYSKSYQPGDEVEGLILWINYPFECVEVTLLTHTVNIVNTKQNKLSKIPIGLQLRGEIVLVDDWFILVVLRGHGKGTLVALPARRHLNDTIPDLTPYKIGDKVRCYGVLNKEDNNILMPICVLKSVFETHNYNSGKPLDSLLKLKRKVQSENECSHALSMKKIKKNHNEESINLNCSGKHNQQNVKETSNITNNSLPYCFQAHPLNINHSIKNLILTNNNMCSSMGIVNKNEKIQYINKESLFPLALAECGFKWENKINCSNKVIESSSSVESEEETEKSKKPQREKIRSVKKKEFEREKEREVREREETLTSCQMPQSIDQFERLVLTNPDSSIIWIQYMTYHLQGTEVDKARAIASRALKTISFREEQERLNVWKAWLNLESRFGSSQSMDRVFQDAIKTNDSRKIYKHMLTVHVDAGRHSDIEKIVNVMVKKFKHDIEVWISCGEVLSQVGMIDKSRIIILEKGLQSLPKNKHIELIIKFAHLENKFGSEERAQALYEKILSSYPKRTDVWSNYVDLLVTSKNINIARKVMDRAISNNLSAKKMKFIFKKYINLEEKYGTSENILHIKKMAAKYIEEKCNVVNN